MIGPPPLMRADQPSEVGAVGFREEPRRNHRAGPWYPVKTVVLVPSLPGGDKRPPEREDRLALHLRP